MKTRRLALRFFEEFFFVNSHHSTYQSMNVSLFRLEYCLHHPRPVVAVIAMFYQF
jgi:hypothetical protein